MREMNRKINFLNRYHAHTWNSEDEYEQYMGKFSILFIWNEENSTAGSSVGSELVHGFE